MRIVLSYVPFKTEEDLGDSRSVMSNVTGSASQREGLYDGTKQSFYSRKNDQDEILRFVEVIFDKQESLSYEQYSAINQSQTSEMFLALMRVLHETLPCSKNFFSMKRKFRARQLECNADAQPQKIREISSPRIVRGLSLGKSPVRRPSSRASNSSAGGDFQSSRLSHQMPDVRVKKNIRGEQIRNDSRQNSAAMSGQSGFLPELSNVNDREDVLSQVSSPKKLTMQTKIRGGRNAL